MAEPTGPDTHQGRDSVAALLVPRPCPRHPIDAFADRPFTSGERAA